MSQMSPELLRVFESDCATGVEDFLAVASPSDLDAVRGVLQTPERYPTSWTQTAIHLAGRIGDRQSAPRIGSILPSLDERGRINAVTALGLIGGPEAQAAVLYAATDQSADVRRFAVHALAHLGTDTSRQRLSELARDDPADLVRAAARRASSAT